MGEDPNDKKEVQEELSRSRKQMEDSRNRLTKLQDDATEFVTNIRVAAHAREASRRIEEEEARRQRHYDRKTHRFYHLLLSIFKLFISYYSSVLFIFPDEKG